MCPFGKYGAVLLGGSAGTQGVLDALERGATDGQALQMGLLNGTFEALFEYVSLDKLLTGKPKSLIRALFRQGGVEASEEFMTTFANNIADILVMAEKSDYQLKIQAYMESGMSREEATKQALLDKCIELGWDAAGGFFSGGISGGISTKVSGINSGRGIQTQAPTKTHTQAETQTQTQAQAQTQTQDQTEAQTATIAQSLEEMQAQDMQPGTVQNDTAAKQAANTAAKPDPAAGAAVEEEYRNRIAYALQYGDYQRALELYREYNNPTLRAYKEFYTLKAFADFAAANGYDISPASAEELSRSNPVKNMPQDTESKNTAERITEDESIRKFRNDIKEGKVSLRISPQKQARHIWGSKEHNAYRERLSKRGDFPAYIREDLTLADLSEIVREKAGNGEITQKSDRSFKEYVDCDEIIGYSYNKKLGKYVPTYRAQIMYSLGDKNIHVVPVVKREREEK